MIVCKVCGYRNADTEEFCANCGRFLAWAGEHVELPPEADEEVEPEPEAPPEPEPQTLLQRAIASVRRRRHRNDDSEDDGSETEGAPDEVGAPSGERATEVVTAEVDGSLDESRSSDAAGVEETEPHTLVATSSSAEEAAKRSDLGDVTDPTTRVAALVGETRTASGEQSAQLFSGAEPATTAVPSQALGGGGNDPSENSSTRGAVLRRPTEITPTERRRRPAATPIWAADITIAPSPDDVYCTVCRQFNAPTRVYCRRCGAELPREPNLGVPLYEPLTWRQRFLHLHRDRAPAPATARPGKWGRSASGGGGSGRRMAIIARVGSVVIMIGLALSFVGPAASPIKSWASKTYHSVIHKVDVTYTQQFAIGANATSAAPNHSAGLAVDDADNTYWQSGSSKRNGVGEKITIVFSQQTTIDRIGILAGAGPTQQDFLKLARPHLVLFDFGNGYLLRENLQDTQNFQHLAIHAKSITSLTMKVLSVYPSPVGHAVAVTEIEFFQRS